MDLHIGLGAGTGQIIAATLTPKEADDGSQAGPLLDQTAASVASFTADRTCDQDSVYAAAERHPDAAIVVPPRSKALLSETGDRDELRWPRSGPHAGP